MRKLLLPTLIMGGIFSLLGSANAEKNWLGVNGGVYLPSSSTTRNLLGDRWVRLGFGPTKFSVRDGLALTSDLNFISQSKGGNKVFLAMPTVGITKTLASKTNSTVPYFTLRAGPAYFDYSITRDATRYSTKRFGVNGNAELGAIYNDRIKLSVRYDMVSRYDGFKFDGLSLNVSCKVARF